MAHLCDWCAQGTEPDELLLGPLWEVNAALQQPGMIPLPMSAELLWDWNSPIPHGYWTVLFCPLWVLVQIFIHWPYWYGVNLELPVTTGVLYITSGSLICLRYLQRLFLLYQIQFHLGIYSGHSGTCLMLTRLILLFNTYFAQQYVEVLLFKDVLSALFQSLLPLSVLLLMASMLFQVLMV